MCVSWQAASKNIRKPCVFEEFRKPDIGEPQRARSGDVCFFRAFISIIERMLFLREKTKGGAVNLNDNNIYIYIYI